MLFSKSESAIIADDLMTAHTDLVPQAVYPKPAAPIFPILSLGTMLPGREAVPASILSAGWILPVTTGRMGLSLALEHMRIRTEDEVLIPAYHCNSMVEPVVHAGARPVFYRVREDASVDLDDVKRRLASRTRALMVTHYFGFPQDLTQIRAFCDAHALVLIEDCAHVFFGEHAGKSLGSYGDYAFASPMKFLPTYDGGCLISHRHRIDRIPTRLPSWRFSAKAMVTILGRSVHYRRLGPLRILVGTPFQVKRLLRGGGRGGGGLATVEAVVEQPRYGFDGYFSGRAGEFDPAWIHTGMSLTSRAIMALAGKSRVFTKRRANYRALREGLAGLSGGRALYPELPASVAPYVFPFLVDDPQRVFPALKRQGVPISRFGEYLWEGFDRSICPMAVEFSRRVLQFACHQELTDAELAWMIATIRQVMRGE